MAPRSGVLSLFGRVKPDRKVMKASKEAVTIRARNPKPLEPGRPSLALLPEDIVLRIIDLLRDDSPNSVVHVASVCSSLYRIARYVQSRRFIISLDSDAAAERLHFVQRNNLEPAIQTLEVSGTGLHGPALQLLDDALPRMTGLRDILWKEAKETIHVKSALERLSESARPRIHVHLFSDVSDAEDVQAKELLTSLIGTPYLFSVNIKVLYTKPQACLELTGLTKQILLSCPNLRKLSLDIGFPEHGCTIWGPFPEYCGFGLTRDERPPPLEELRIFSYPWGLSHGHPEWGINCAGYPTETPDEMDYWADTFDWSRLQSLREQSISLGQRIAPKLTTLKKVEFKYTWDREASVKFFETVPSLLESITIPTLSSAGIAPITRHAEALRLLNIHQHELFDGKWNEDVMTVDSLSLLCEQLPSLEELSIDLGRSSNDWPWEALKVVAGFKHLQSLKLCFELGINNMEAPLLPSLSASSAYKLFSYLREHSVNRERPLQHLEVYSGSPPARGQRPSERTHWLQENWTAFICKISERDDEAKRGLFTVSSLKLSKEQNDRMQRFVNGEETSTPVIEERIDLKIAIYGPMPMNEWIAWHRRKRVTSAEPSGRTHRLRKLLRH